MGKVLFILGSHDELLDGKGKTGWYLPVRSYCPSHANVMLTVTSQEAAHPYYEVSPHHEVVFASLKGGKAPLDPNSAKMFADDEGCKKFQADKEAQHKVENTLELGKVDPSQYDAVFAVGGHAPMFEDDDPTMKKVLGEFWKQGKLVSAVCHGPAVLSKVVDPRGNAIMTDRRVTGFTNEEEEQVGLTKAVPFLLEDRIDAIGGKFEKAEKPWGAHVVQDGQLLTGQNPASASGVGKAIVEYLQKQK